MREHRNNESNEIDDLTFVFCIYLNYLFHYTRELFTYQFKFDGLMNGIFQTNESLSVSLHNAGKKMSFVVLNCFWCLVSGFCSRNRQYQLLKLALKWCGFFICSLRLFITPFHSWAWQNFD